MDRLLFMKRVVIEPANDEPHNVPADYADSRR